MDDTAGQPDTAHPDDRHRSIVSFVRRGGRLTAKEQQSWDAYRDRYVLDVPRAMGSTSIDPAWRFTGDEIFGSAAPVIYDIGSGNGESVTAGALANPDHHLLAVEVYRPGVARTLRSLADAGVSNVRIVQADAVALLTTGLPAESADELWLFFPDPWHKKRHHKRRIVTAEFAALVARVLKPGGIWRIATDWPEYADHIGEVVAQSPDFEIVSTQRFATRPLTRFERRGIAAGRPIADLALRRVTGAQPHDRGTTEG